MNEDILIIKLRDCFTAGYTFPQFCVDNNIKKPLFVAIDERRADFIWEIFVQFKYDKRINPKFTLLNGKMLTLNKGWGLALNLGELTFEKPTEIKFDNYDGIIVLNAVRLNVKSPKVIYLDQLKDYFTKRTCAEIPLLHFLQRHPKVNLIVTNFPKQPQFDAEFTKKLPLKRLELLDKVKANEEDSIPKIFRKLGYNNKDLISILSIPIAKANLDGSTYMVDSDPLIGIKNGKRMTAYQPENYVNKFIL